MQFSRHSRVPRPSGGEVAQLATAEDVNVANGALRPRLFLNAGVGRERTDSDNVNGGEPISLTHAGSRYQPDLGTVQPGRAWRNGPTHGYQRGDGCRYADEQQVALQASTAYTNLWRGTQYEIAQQARQARDAGRPNRSARETGVSGEAELIQVQGRLSLSQSNESAALNALQDARANYRGWWASCLISKSQKRCWTGAVRHFWTWPTKCIPRSPHH